MSKQAANTGVVRLYILNWRDTGADRKNVDLRALLPYV
jgi:hypothetical protein